MYNYPWGPGFGYNDGGGYWYSLLNDLQEYIHDELKDSRYYAILAEKAPVQRAKQLLLEFSDDEKMHAHNFQKAYYMLTGQYYQPAVEEPQVSADFCEAVKARIIAESGDFKKYGEQYLKAPNKYLQDLFYMTRTYEGIHAMRMPILLSDGKCG